MTMITMVSAAGSPGVTTTAVGFALTADRPTLLVEADPTGGSAVLAGFFRGASEHHRGLLDLAWAHREGRLADELPHTVMGFPGSTASLLPGIRTHAQARNAAAKAQADREARLTAALAAGRSLKEAAALRRVTHETARTQLRAVLAKTGARGQADLARLVAGLPALAARAGADEKVME